MLGSVDDRSYRCREMKYNTGYIGPVTPKKGNTIREKESKNKKGRIWNKKLTDNKGSQGKKGRDKEHKEETGKQGSKEKKTEN